MALPEHDLTEDGNMTFETYWYNIIETLINNLEGKLK